MLFTNIREHVLWQNDHFGRSVVLSSDNAAFFLYAFKPGQAMTEHSHPFSTEYLLVLEGEAVISVGTESVLAVPDAVVVIPAESVHAMYNHTQRPLLIGSFMTPKP